MTLQHKRGFVVGIANEHSIAWGCARAFCRAGATLAVPWQSENTLPYVEPLFAQLHAPIRMPLDVGQPEQMAAVFDAIATQWGTIDFVLHSSPRRRRQTCMAVWSTVRRKGSRWRWDTSCLRSSGWRGSQSR